MVVKSPAPLLLRKVRVCGVLGEQIVESMRGAIDVSVAQVIDDYSQPLGQRPKAGFVARTELGHRGRVHSEDAGQGGQRVRRLRITPAG